MKRVHLGFVVLLQLFAGLTLSQGAAAQQLPEGLQKADPASSGKTDVAQAGFQSAAKAEEDAEDTTEGDVSAGGMITSGNSRQMSLTSAANFRARRSASQFKTGAAINFARAAVEDSELETTVLNLQGQLRYDYFFAQAWAAFLSASAVHARFQGLDLRLNIDPGVAYYFIDNENQQGSFEAGYDFQYDVRREEAIAEAEAEGEMVDKTETRHSARLFLGYDQNFNERVSLATGLEYIQSVLDIDLWRLNWDASLRSNITGNFSSAVSFNLRYDNAPLAGVEEVDILTSFNLVYTML